MINHYLVRISLISAALLLLIFLLVPKLDLTITELFYSENNDSYYPDNQGNTTDKKPGEFLYKNHPLIYLFYRSIPIITSIFIAVSVTRLLYLLSVYSWKKVLTSAIIYLIISAAIGPGIIVNTIFKEYSGRARPSQVTYFGGNYDFSPVLKITDSCTSNCSFSSGHAAMGYYFSAFAYVLPDYFTRIYLAGIIFGTIVGLARIIMGGHFSSDIIASCLVVLLSNHVIYLLWKKIILRINRHNN